MKANFEKEAEEYADKKDRTLTSYHTGLKEGFEAGANHGYQKAIDDVKSFLINSCDNIKDAIEMIDEFKH